MNTKFKVGDKVKFVDDADSMAGNVLSISWNSESGFVYVISSKYFDSEKHDMIIGSKICKEDELVAVTENATPAAPQNPTDQGETTND